MRELAQKQKSTVLTQLASRILAATRQGSQDDIFFCKNEKLDRGHDRET